MSVLGRVQITLVHLGLTLQLLSNESCFGALWVTNAPLNTSRSFQTTTLLTNGTILVVGGQGNSGALSNAEIFFPQTSTWTNTGCLNVRRQWHTATLLQNGKVLVAGGLVAYGNYTDSAELYDPATGTWTTTGSLNTGRYDHTATLLANGKVLVAGGWNGTTLATAELYDPATETWTATASMGTARAAHSATLLASGYVLMVGGYNDSDPFLNSAEIYRPIPGNWSNAGYMTTARDHHTATLLADNKNVLIAGGITAAGVTNSAELYSNGIWRTTGALHVSRGTFAATLLPDRKVLVEGGVIAGAGSPATNAVELYDPTFGSWKSLDTLNTGRFGHTATLLSDGSVLVLGGLKDGYFLSNAENYTGAMPFPLTATLQSNGLIRIRFTNEVDALFTIYTATNLSTPFSNWTIWAIIPAVTGPGRYEISDTILTNRPRFYRISSP